MGAKMVKRGFISRKGGNEGTELIEILNLNHI